MKLLRRPRNCAEAADLGKIFHLIDLHTHPSSRNSSSDPIKKGKPPPKRWKLSP
jgi:hypothetical protein